MRSTFSPGLGLNRPVHAPIMAPYTHGPLLLISEDVSVVFFHPRAFSRKTSLPLGRFHAHVFPVVLYWHTVPVEVYVCVAVHSLTASHRSLVLPTSAATTVIIKHEC